MTALILKHCPTEDILSDFFCAEGKLYEQNEHGGAHIVGECCKCVKATHPSYVAPDRCPTCGAHLRCGCDDPIGGLPRKLDRSLLKREQEVLG